MIPTWDKLWATVPDADQIGTVLLAVLGLLVGWTTHPLCWPCGPVGFVVLLASRASQESDWNPAIAGDTEDARGNSYGVFQFHTPTWTSLTGRALEDRGSAFLSGYYAAVNVQTALLTDWRWWGIYVPVWQAAVIQRMWTGGTSQSSADRLGDAWAAMMREGRAWPAYVLYRLVSLPLSIAFGGALVAVALARRRR